MIGTGVDFRAVLFDPEEDSADFQLRNVPERDTESERLEVIGKFRFHPVKRRLRFQGNAFLFPVMLVGSSLEKQIDGSPVRSSQFDFQNNVFARNRSKKVIKIQSFPRKLLQKAAGVQNQHAVFDGSPHEPGFLKIADGSLSCFPVEQS